MAFPDSYAMTPDGKVLIADGMNPMAIWDGLKSLPVAAGVLPPDTACALVGSGGPGEILGSYAAYVRFVDADGNVSNLSPLSNIVLFEDSGGFVINATNTAPIQITTDAPHGLTSGDLVRIESVQGVTAANSVWEITVVDANNFTLDNSSADGDYVATTGTWVPGQSQVDYTSVPVPTSPQVTRRQILRNTDGQFTTFYVDVDTDDLVSTSFSSTNTDDVLSTNTAVPLLSEDGAILAQAHDPPPDFKCVVAHHNGRMFAAVDRVYDAGAIVVTNGNTTVVGINTEWTAALAGRNLFVLGGTKTYPIASVDVAAQTITLTVAYADTTDPYATYAIRPDDGERRLVWFTQAGQPQSWNPTYAIQIQEDGDELTGLMQKGSFLYILEQRHIYRFTFQSDPAVDGFIYLSCERGCINNRCWVQVEENTLMMDQDGIHAFGGGQESQPISTDIQRLFQPLDELDAKDFAINWNARRLFHAAHFPHEEVVRWFVSMGDSYITRHALCYHVRTHHWWIEEYPVAITASALSLVKFARQVFVGSQGRRTLSLNQGNLDGLDPRSGSTYGTVTDVDLCSISDGSATFPEGLAGRTVSITTGRGKLQQRTIHSVVGNRINVTQPWLVLPEVGSTYQIGGIHYRFVSGQFAWAAGQQEMKRRVGVSFYPTETPSTMFIRMYNDQNEDPIIFAQTTFGLAYEGIGAENGSPELSLDMTDQSAYAQQRLESRRDDNFTGPRQITFEFIGVATENGVVVASIDLDGTNASEQGN